MPKSICFIVTQGELGGAQRYILDLATNLKNTYQITVLAGKEKIDLKTELEKTNIPIVLIQHLKRDIHPLHDMLAVFELRKILKILQPDIVHLNSSKAGILGSLAAKLAGIDNVIFTAHGFAFLEPHSLPTRLIYFWTEKFASFFRSKIITVSDFDRKEAIRMNLAPAEKFVTIHNGIDPSTAPSTVLGVRSGNKQTLLPEPVEGVLIGTIANLYPTKGIKYLVEAAHILYSSAVADHIPHSKFVVIGGGPEKKNLEYRISNMGLKDKFILLGARPNAAQYLSQFDIFVLPSVKEGFPYAVLEAAAAGLPIVATAVGGIPEVIDLSLPHPCSRVRDPSPSPGEGNSEEEAPLSRPWREAGREVGILVPPKDPQALTRAIKFLIQNPTIAHQLGQNARERAKKFTIQRMVKETENVYQSIIES